MAFKITETLDDVSSNLAINLDLAKDEGKKVVGCLCSYSPKELIHAANAIPVGLCGSTQGPIAKAEEVLSVDQCPKVKATYGRAISGSCPLFHLADCIISETTCDGRKKMYELLEREKPMYVMDLPQKPDSDAALDHWVAEVKAAKRFLEQQLDVTITDDDLRRGIDLENRLRMAKTKLFNVLKHNPSPISGLDFTKIMTKLNYSADYEAYIDALEQFHNELKEHIANKDFVCNTDRPRILWTGLGNSLGCSKVLEIVEESGGIVVCSEGCGGVTRTEDVIELGENDDPIKAIAKRYLRVTCACMTPNNQRLSDLERLAAEFGVDGVIDLVWQFCQPFEIESYRVRELVTQQLNLPFLHVVTDYSQSDTEQLRVRIEGFLEQINTRKEYAVC